MGLATEKIILFGATGAIGGAIKTYFEKEGWEVVSVTRQDRGEAGELVWDPLISGQEAEIEALKRLGPFDAACWAQGANGNDSIYTFDREVHEEMYRANVTYTLQSLHELLKGQIVKKPARFCVISSIWQERARQNKLSYSVTKSALRGLILSAATDLGGDGHLINAVLPGVIDTPMTRKNLSTEQVESVSNGTKFKRLPSLQDVASAVYSLCCRHNLGMTGQFLAVDLGYSNVRIL